MGIPPPTYETAVSEIAKDKIIAYRLYLHYKKESTLVRPNLRECMKGKLFVGLVTKPPSKLSINPVDVPIEEVTKEFDSNEFLTVVFEGDSFNSLQELSKLFTSHDYWNGFSYTSENFKLSQCYTVKSVKRIVKKGDSDLHLMVTDANSYKILNVMYLLFTGSLSEEPKYALHIKFRKSNIFTDSDLDMRSYPFRNYYSSSPPIVSIIFEGGEAVAYHRESHYTGPTQEFVFKSSNLMTLKNIEEHYFNMQIPSDKSPCHKITTTVLTETIESVQRGADFDRLVIKFCECRIEFHPFIDFYSE